MIKLIVSISTVWGERLLTLCWALASGQISSRHGLQRNVAGLRAGELRGVSESHLWVSVKPSGLHFPKHQIFLCMQCFWEINCETSEVISFKFPAMIVDRSLKPLCFCSFQLCQKMSLKWPRMLNQWLKSNRTATTSPSHPKPLEKPSQTPSPSARKLKSPPWTARSSR